MSRPPYDDHSYDVNAALRRASSRWHPTISATSCEGAFLDRVTLATEVVRLRDALTAAENELTEVNIERLIEQIEEQP